MKKKDYIQFYEDNEHRAVVHKETFRIRVRDKGMSWEDALTYVNDQRKYDKEYYEYRDKAVANGMHACTFEKRVLYRGMSYEEALNKKVKKRYKIFTKSQLEIAASYGITWKILEHYRKTRNLTSQEALEYAIKHYKPRKKMRVESESNIVDEIKLLLRAGMPVRKKKYVEFIKENKELFEDVL